jgi:hypothetical protein
VRRIIAGLAGLGLAAGAGSVVYNHNGATVRIRGANGQVQNVHIRFSGKRYHCPSGEDAKLNPLVIRAGRIKLTIKHVDAELMRIKAKYHHASKAPRPVVMRAYAEIKQAKRLESAFNADVDRYNAVIDADCTPASGG